MSIGMCANEARADRRSAGRDEGTLQVIFNHAVVRSLSPSNDMAYVSYSAGIDFVSGALAKPKNDGQHTHEKMLLANHRVAPTTNPNCNRLYSANRLSAPRRSARMRLRPKHVSLR